MGLDLQFKETNMYWNICWTLWTFIDFIKKALGFFYIIIYELKN